MTKVEFCSHAEEKFIILRKHGFLLSKRKIIKALNNPDKIEKGYGGRWIAQKGLDERHVLRVVFEKNNGLKLVVTFYPGRRDYYES